MAENRLDIAKQLQQEHEVVLGIVNRLEHLAEQAARDEREQGWGESVRDSLSSLQSHLKNHFAFEEFGGFMEEVVHALPSVSRQVERLRTDHERMLADLGRVSSIAGECAAVTGPPPPNLCEEVHRFLEMLRQHENEENDLVQRAFLDDLGTVD